FDSLRAKSNPNSPANIELKKAANRALKPAMPRVLTEALLLDMKVKPTIAPVIVEAGTKTASGPSEAPANKDKNPIPKTLARLLNVGLGSLPRPFVVCFS